MNVLLNGKIRAGQYVGTTAWGNTFAANSLESLRKRAAGLRKFGVGVQPTAGIQVGSGEDAYVQPIHNAL